MQAECLTNRSLVLPKDTSMILNQKTCFSKAHFRRFLLYKCWNCKGKWNKWNKALVSCPFIKVAFSATNRSHFCSTKKSQIQLPSVSGWSIFSLDVKWIFFWFLTMAATLIIMWIWVVVGGVWNQENLMNWLHKVFCKDCLSLSGCLGEKLTAHWSTVSITWTSFRRERKQARVRGVENGEQMREVDLRIAESRRKVEKITDGQLYCSWKSGWVGRWMRE